MTETTKSRKTPLIVIAVVVVILLGIGIGTAVWFVTRDAREDLSLRDVSASSSQNDGFAREALAGMVDDTAALCAGVPDCIEGYEAQKVDLLRFTSKEAAAAYTSTQPDSYQSDWIVLVYKDASLSANGRKDAQTFIDTLWTSD